MMRVLKWMPFACAFILVSGGLFLYNLILIGSANERPGGSLCFDCGLPAGFPFTLYFTSTIAGGEGLVWGGVFSNAVIAIVLGTLVGFFTQHICKRISKMISSSGLK